MSIAQQLMPIYNITVSQNKINVAFNVTKLLVQGWIEVIEQLFKVIDCGPLGHWDPHLPLGILYSVYFITDYSR